MKTMKTFKAFTLAEVLITLAIIGVVAALTIPTVVTNYKSKALETQKKKAMSVLSNGFRLLMANDDVTSLKNAKIASCRHDKACLTNEIKRVFNVIADNNSENSIFDTMYQFDNYKNKVWKSDNLQNIYIFVTSDGMIFGVRLKYETWENLIAVVISADINGIKNPNKGGQDFCQYVINTDGTIEDHCGDMTSAVCSSAGASISCDGNGNCDCVK